jgi:hypothetical protein
MLGEEIGVFYLREELSELLRLTQSHSDIDRDELGMLSGALSMKSTGVEEVTCRASLPKSLFSFLVSLDLGTATLCVFLCVKERLLPYSHQYQVQEKRRWQSDWHRTAVSRRGVHTFPEFPVVCVALQQIMVPIDRILMVDGSTVLSREKVLELAEPQYSRLPVFFESQDNVVGLLLAHDLTAVAASLETDVRVFIHWPARINFGLTILVLSFFHQSFRSLALLGGLLVNFAFVHLLPVAAPPNRSH